MNNSTNQNKLTLNYSQLQVKMNFSTEFSFEDDGLNLNQLHRKLVKNQEEIIRYKKSA